MRTSGLCRRLRKACLVSERHPATYRHFRSYPALVAERHRQLAWAPSCTIHPFSCFSLYWNTFMVLINCFHVSVSAFRLAFVLHQLGKLPQMHFVDHILLGLHLVCMLDIVVKLHTGFLEGTSNIVLDRLRCICHYVQRYFVLDLLSCLPISYILLLNNVTNPRVILIAHLVALLRLSSICRDLRNFVVFLKSFQMSYAAYGTLRNILLFLLSAHLLGCLTFAHGACLYYWTGQMPDGYHQIITNNSTALPNQPIAERYMKALFISFSALFGTDFSTYSIFLPLEIAVNIFTILYSFLFMVYVMVCLIRVYFTKHNPIIRYHELMNQLQEYMRQKQFPVALKKRVYAFYYYRFQGSYFRDDRLMASLSDQLRNEIALHTCHKLVNKVVLFEGLPADVVGSILGCLRAEVYLPNDLVARAGDIGDCMYLIANGTVAVYSLMGVEVCHLEDGAYFGEVALLMKDSKRVATVVAVEITQVYRLDADHFHYFIEKYEDLHERIEALASQRMHETVVLDEEFKREREHTSSGQDFYHPILSRHSPHATYGTTASRNTLQQYPRNSDNQK